MLDRKTEQTVALLLDAAKLAMRNVAGLALSSQPDGDPARTALLLKLWSIAAGEDIAAEIERIRQVCGGEDDPLDR